MNRPLLLFAVLALACDRVASNTTAPGSHGGAGGAGGATAGATPPSSGGATDASSADASKSTDVDVGNCDSGQPFADPVVESAVRAEAGRAEGPLSADLARVVLLRAPGAASLAGVECLTALESLITYGGTLSDLSPLTGLEKLRTANVAGNRVEDLAPLSGHPLRTIDASDNRIASLDGLVLPAGGCEHTLNLQRNPIDASRVEPFCRLDWVVTWGGEGDADPEQCNVLCP